MIRESIARGAACFIASFFWVGSSVATPFFFSTGNPDGRIATASRPASGGKVEIESADDFVLTQTTSLTGATFTGLLTGGATTTDIAEIRVEIYRVFPKDSTNPPSGNVPTRANSPSDVEFEDRDTAAANLSVTTSVLNTSFTAQNSVLNGIHAKPNQTTGGEGSVTGEEVEFTATFTVPLVLPPDHYFFVPQVEVGTANGEFLWLSASKPIVSPGTPFMPDLQSWIRNEDLAPDWLRIGTDIVGPLATGTAPTFNAAFSLVGAVPEPGSLILVGAGLIVLWWYRRKGGDE